MTLWDQLTDAQREALVLEIVGALPASGIPNHLRAGLVRYFSDGILPGGFLQAVLCNNLREAVKRTGAGSEFALSPLIDFLLAHAPSASWGSREAVLGWTTTPTSLEIGAPQLEEGDRQLVLLSLALCALDRPGFDHALSRIAEQLAPAGVALYTEFKRLNADRFKERL
jgi:hypothetical protein